MNEDNNDFTREVIEALLNVEFSDLTSEVVHASKRMMLDGIACAIAGSRDAEYEPIATYANSHVGVGTTPGPLGRLYDPSTGALLVGAATHILDYDDVQTTMGGHPTSTLLPVMLSLGYEVGSSGSEVLHALVIGAELEARIGRAMNPAHYGVGWHPTGVIGCLGASLAACLLLKLDVDQTCNAVGIATSYASGTKANFGTTTKSLHAGFAARAGIESALLTKAGATGNSALFEDRFGGFFNLYTPEVDRASLIAGIGKSFIVDNPGISFKLLPCCGSIQSSVWAVIRLFEEGEYEPTEIAAIRAFVDPKRIAHTSRTDVKTGLEGKFSSQYCQAVAALTGRLTLSDFDDAQVQRPERQDLLRRVSVIPAQDMDSWPNPDDSHTGSRGAMVEIEDVRGKVFSHFNLVPRGYAADPASDDVLLTKFRDCVQRDGRTDTEVATLSNLIMRLEAVDNVRQLVEWIWRTKIPDKGP